MEFNQTVYDRLIRDALALFAQEGFKVPKDIEFAINTRATSFAGICRMKKPSAASPAADGKPINVFRIELCRKYLEQEQVTERDAFAILCHELIHTLPYSFNHGRVFCRYMDTLNKRYDLNITLKAPNCSESPEEDYTYLFTCTHCGNVFGYKSKCKSVRALLRHPETMTCGNCKRKGGIQPKQKAS